MLERKWDGSIFLVERFLTNSLRQLLRIHKSVHFKLALPPCLIMYFSVMPPALKEQRRSHTERNE